MQAAQSRRDITSIIGAKTVVAVVEIADADAAPDLARVLGDAGISALEITLRTPAAFAAISHAASVDALPVGAGTVTHTQAAIDTVEAGACFLASPVFDAALAEHCLAHDIALLPGVITPADVNCALNAGFRQLKLFPAGNFGGISLVKSLSAVFPDVSFIPTGGVTAENALEYLRHPSVAAIGGTWVAPAALINERDWSEIARRAGSVMDQVRSLEL